MKKIAVILFLVTLLFSCKKESTPTPQPQTDPLPIIVKYDINQQTASFINLTDTTTKLNGFTSQYSIRFEYQYKDFDNIVRHASGYFFAQNDTGSIYLTKPPVRNYAVIESTHDIEGYHLYFKFDIGYDIFDVSPAVIRPSDTEITITKKSNGRSMTIPADEFRAQGFTTIRYDK